MPSNEVNQVLEDHLDNLWFATAGGVARYDGVGWRTFSSADELGHYGVSTIFEDRSHNLWFATTVGLTRFDGAHWRTFTTADGLTSNYVTAMLEDRGGNLWAVTDHGVSRYDRSTWESFNAPDLASDFVEDILEDRAGSLWFATSAGVSRYDGSSWRTFTTVDGLAGDYALFMLLERTGHVLVGTTRGVSRYDGSGWSIITTPDGLPVVASSVLEDRAGNLWFAAGSGVSRFDGSTWRTFSPSDGLGGYGLNSMFEDHAGSLWFALSAVPTGETFGVSRYDGLNWETFTAADGLLDADVHFIMQDRSGNLWFATRTFGDVDGLGVSRYDGSRWKLYTPPDGVPEASVMHGDRRGNLWVATSAGVRRFGESRWTTFTTANGLTHDNVTSIMEDRVGTLWFGTGDGVSLYDDLGWRPFTANGVPLHIPVDDIVEDRKGNLWFATPHGVSRWNGSDWKTFTTADGLLVDRVDSMLEDRAGNMWFSSQFGVNRYDGSTWDTLTTADGLAWNNVKFIVEDRSGNLWFATGGGVTRYDGTTWQTFDRTNGLGANDVSSILEDNRGHLWFAVSDQLGPPPVFRITRFDGSEWRVMNESGIPAGFVGAIEEDRFGGLWFGGRTGLTHYEPDRVPPRAVFLSAPPPLSSSTNQDATFIAAFEETQGIEFSHRLDGPAWSDWSPFNTWFRNGIDRGPHTLEVRARDAWGNVDTTATLAIFEIDDTPPTPVIREPLFGQAVHGSVEIRGTATDHRFRRFGVAVRPAGAPTWDPPDATSLAQSETPVAEGLLATWETSTLPDGRYEIRLAVEDTLGLTAGVQVEVRLDNQAPADEQTAPARVNAATGGDIYTLNGELHLYFSPHSFSADALVTIDPVRPDSVPETLPSGATRVLPGYQLGWSGADLEKPTRFELSLAAVNHQASSGPLAIHYSADGTNWQRLGGAIESGRITLVVKSEGRYALYAGGTEPAGRHGLSDLSFTPRVFSPRGTYADRRVGIAFTLGQPGTVTVRVYNRGGRVVREVVRSAPLGAGSNLVWWDGRDREGEIVVDGLYLVTVEALGETRSHTLAVVR